MKNLQIYLSRKHHEALKSWIEKNKSFRESRRDRKYFSDSRKWAENTVNKWPIKWWFKFMKSYWKWVIQEILYQSPKKIPRIDNIPARVLKKLRHFLY